MMVTKLSTVLLNLGFFSAYGTMEFPGMRRDGILVQKGTPNTHDSNNGITVVYDEEGRPWILHNSHLTAEVASGLADFDLKRGAHVPHSNDGGNFVRTMGLRKEAEKPDTTGESNE